MFKKRYNKQCVVPYQSILLHVQPFFSLKLLHVRNHSASLQRFLVENLNKR